MWMDMANSGAAKYTHFKYYSFEIIASDSELFKSDRRNRDSTPFEQGRHRVKWLNRVKDARYVGQ